MSMNLASLKSLKKPGSPPRKLNFRQKLVRSAQKFSHAILNGSSKALSKAVIFLAAVEVALVVQSIMFLATIVTSAMQTDTVSMARDLTYAVIGAVSAIFGIFGAKQLDRGVLLLYFVLVMWGIASSTSNINSNFLEQSKQSDICNHALTSEEQTNLSGLQACSSQLALLTVKLVVIAVNVVLQVVSGWMALRLSEKIQEEEEGEQQSKMVQSNMEINMRRTSMMIAGKRKGSMAVGGGGLAAFGNPSGPLAAFGARR